MTFRKILFWAHLSAGVVFGLFIALMSFTGVLLTYERQMIEWAENAAVPDAAGREVLSADAMAARSHELGARPGTQLIFGDNPGEPVRMRISRRNVKLLDPYTGDEIKGAGVGVKSFMRTITHLHRWLAFSGETRNAGRALTGAANLGFLFILVSGLYLWLPRRASWRMAKMNLFLRRHLPDSKARDYHWHHVFGIWALAPLLAVVISGVVISYPWASALVFQAYGEEAPKRRGPPPADRFDAGKLVAGETRLDLSALLEKARSEADGWQRTVLYLPAKGDAKLRIELDRGNGVQDGKKTMLIMRTSDGQITARGGSKRSGGMKARFFLRFLHTGEIYGWIGQTLAGLASLISLLLAYTGLALAWRRLIYPLVRRRAA